MTHNTNIFPQFPTTNIQPSLQIIPTHTIVTSPAPAKTNLGDSFKPKKAGKHTSHIIFVLDDSASMRSCLQPTIAGFNEFLEMQKKDAEETKIKTKVSLYKFDGYSVTGVFVEKDVSEVEPLNEKTYNPSGSTNLHDAIGSVMLTINNQLASVKKKNRDSVIITILTDGQENASRTFSSNDVKVMVEKAEGKNWSFMFLGANIDAFAAGSTMGFSSQNTLQYNTQNMGETMRTASAMTSRLKTAYATTDMDVKSMYDTLSFTDEERKAVVDGK